MAYIICFIISILLLLYLMAFEKKCNVNVVLLVIVVAIGNGGYYALSQAKNLEEAILANNITYVLGLFAPLVLFIIVCDVCKVRLSRVVRLVLYCVQVFMYLMVCTIGTSTIYYKTVDFYIDEAGPHLVKTYGIMHTVFWIILMSYTFVGIGIAIYSLNRDTTVSRVNVESLLFVNILTVGVYIIERLTKVQFDLTPIFSTFTILVMTFIAMKIYTYSILDNHDLQEEELKDNGYVFFNKELKYMGCNRLALDFFPEFETWELEKKIPGNGGRFNTFLRQPLMSYTKEGGIEKSTAKTYQYKGEIYRYEIGTLIRNKRWVKGYYIKVSNVTDVVNQTNE